ncbi:MAG: patatin-like phospholipase family protein [Rhodospirillales bacterium]|nr:patatin-like phospholipase family protein [Rhodospirillales bacterium]MCB9995839.1 patatin-like phospholipase family protein [Rhodospirillales bacterium]
MRHLFNRQTRLGLALQGGGSYGAYTKGVLKALFNSQTFRSPDLSIKAVTGASAGAVNGALITYGLNDGGPDKAVSLLDSFWDDVGEKGRINKVWYAMDPTASGWPNLPHSMVMASHFVPNGYVSGHLKRKLEEHIPDWDKVRNGPVKLFVNAVREDAQTKERHHIVFKNQSLSADAVTASGALKEFGAHTIDGQKFYDGAYWRNPCLADIMREDITDLLVITIQQVPADGVTPEHQDDARARHDKPGHDLLTEELHNHIAYIHQQHPKLNLHVISLKVDEKWDRTSRMNTDPQWLAELEKMGYEDAQAWLTKNARHLGRQSTYEAPDRENTGSLPKPGYG